MNLAEFRMWWDAAIAVWQEDRVEEERKNREAAKKGKR